MLSKLRSPVCIIHHQQQLRLQPMQHLHAHRRRLTYTHTYTHTHTHSHTHTLTLTHKTFTPSINPSARGAAAVSSSPRLQPDNRRTTSSQPWPTHVLRSRHWLTAGKAHLPLNTPPMTQCSSPPYTPPPDLLRSHTHTHTHTHTHAHTHTVTHMEHALLFGLSSTCSAKRGKTEMEGWD